ncbi:hypothetical protein [Rhodococcus sp. NPDC047139]|uniref:hypothetical protein n=1 Tax=Rhodococcus sp. NPDC047139 TaxID=3155141 RepID=UPI0033F610E7
MRSNNTIANQYLVIAIPTTTPMPNRANAVFPFGKMSFTHVFLAHGIRPEADVDDRTVKMPLPPVRGSGHL